MNYLDSRNYSIPFKWLVLHILLGITVVYSHTVAQLWGIVALVVGIGLILKNRNRNEEVARVIVYLASQEVLLKVCDAQIGSEFIKYIVVLFCVIGILISDVPYPKNRLWILFLILLIPSTILSINSIKWFENIRYSLSGIVVLAISAYYFTGRCVEWNNYKKILGAIILPLISLSIVVTLETPDFSSVEFTATSMFETTGGFGPVHLSVVLGVGILILITLSLIKQSLVINLLGNYIAICFLAFRLLLSFSRTGVVALVVSLGAILFCLIMNNSIKLKKILIYLSIIVMAGIVVWNKVDDVTHGVASFRFSGRNSVGDKLDDVTSGRIDLFTEELSMFAENPILGIGAGNTSSERQHRFGQIHSSHTEYSRLLCEHGILGIVMNLILLGVPLSFLKKTRGVTRLFFVAFIVYSLLSMVSAATRTTLPLLIYGLAFLRIKEDYIKK